MAQVVENPTKGERTRQRLLDLAVDRFATDGYRRTSVAAVARDAGLSAAAAYAYFPSKEGLFRAAVDADASALIDELREQEEQEDAPLRERLPARLERLVLRLDGHPLARRVLSGLEPTVTGRLLTLPSLVALRARTTAELAAAQDAGALRAGVDPTTVSLALETLLLSLVMTLLQVGDLDEGEVEARRVAVVELFDAALRT